MTKEIGSEFEKPSPELLSSTEGVPLPPDAVLVGTGRHALAVVALDLLARGIKTVVVPDHYCESMIEPFLSAGMSLQLCGTTEDLTLCERSLADLLAEGRKHLAILHSETFGTPTSSNLQTMLDAASRSDIPTVVDRTHSLFSPITPRADYEVASLRKLLPIPDGGYVRGLRVPPPLTETPEHRTFCNLRLDAAEQKTAFLHQASTRKSHLETFALAEKLLDDSSKFAAISDYSRAILRVLDFEAIRSARLTNAAALESALQTDSVQVVNSAGWRNSPAYVVITLSNVESLRAHLIGQQIYCPVHWPRPKLNHPNADSWRTDLLSLPIDHRYTADDMRRIAAAINEFQEMNTSD